MNEYQIALLIGASCAGLLFLTIVLSGIVQRLYGFVNDSDRSDYNFIIKRICKVFGLKPTNGCWSFDACKGSGWISDSSGESAGDLPLVISFLSALAFPLLALIAFKLYALTLSIFLFIALMFLARIVVRGKKLFNKHIKDKDAHKG